MTSFPSSSLGSAADYWWVLLLVADTAACAYLAAARSDRIWAVLYLTAMVIGAVSVLIGTVGAQFASDPDAYWAHIQPLQDLLAGYASDERDGTFWNILQAVFSKVAIALAASVAFLGGWDFLAFADSRTQPKQTGSQQ